jgi:hypothetical protein
VRSRKGRPTAVEREALRDWHRLIGLLRTVFFSGSPFVVEMKRYLSVRQQQIDVVIVRRGRRRFIGRQFDGLEGVRPHNPLTLHRGRSTVGTVRARRALARASQQNRCSWWLNLILVPEEKLLVAGDFKYA